MNTINIDVSIDASQLIEIGKQGENGVTEVLFDISAWETEFGAGDSTLYIKRKGDAEPYYIELESENGAARWVVSNIDTANKGNGSVQLNHIVNNVVKRTKVFAIKVEKSLVDSGDVPNPYDDWLEEIRQGVAIVEDFSEHADEVINEWLDDHPEATTTVQDDSLTTVKIKDKQITKEKLGDDVTKIISGYEAEKVSYGLTNYSQDAAIYNGKVFEFGSNDGVVKVYAIETKALLAITSLDGGIKPHGNAVTFGHKANVSDTYPLMYVTGYNGLDENGDPLPRGTCFVYKVNNDYSTQLIQSITIGFTNDVDLWLGTEVPQEVVRWGDFFIDADADALYCLTSMSTNGIMRSRVYKFDIPDTSESSVTLLESDIQLYFDLPIYPYPQGATVKDGILYIVCGNENQVVGSAALHIVDLDKQKQIGSLSLSDIMNEPEAVFEYQGEIYLAKGTFYTVGFVSGFSNVGNVEELQTSDSRTLVHAINENAGKIATINNQLLGINEIKGTGDINDADNAELMTLYWAYVSAANVPETGMLFTYGTSSDRYQFIINRTSIYSRSYTQSDSGWSNWRKFDSSIIS